MKSLRSKGDDKTLAAKKKEGFVPASALTPAMLEHIATRRSSERTFVFPRARNSTNFA